MVRPPCCDKAGIKKGPWTPEEDVILVSYIQQHGPGNWTAVPATTGLLRCSKSCRLRWDNYLRPGIKRGKFTPHEEVMIINLQALLGNKWAAIATYLPQRTDNDIKKFWNTHLKKKLKKLQSTAAMAADDAKSRGQNVAENCYASNAESNESRFMQSWISSSSSSLQGNTFTTTTTTSDPYTNNICHEFGKIPSAKLQCCSIQHSEITSDEHELGDIMPLDCTSINAVASSCDQEKVHILHDDNQEKMEIDEGPPLSYLENWTLEAYAASQDEDGVRILPIF